VDTQEAEFHVLEGEGAWEDFQVRFVRSAVEAGFKAACET
jgi:hypothetical protein